jgi:hypothetical protein
LRALSTANGESVSLCRTIPARPPAEPARGRRACGYGDSIVDRFARRRRRGGAQRGLVLRRRFSLRFLLRRAHLGDRVHPCRIGPAQLRA